MGSSIAMIGMIVLSAGLFETPPPPPKGTTRTQEERFARARGLMVQRQIAAGGISDSAVLEPMRSAPRHLFVAESHRGEAYEAPVLAEIAREVCTIEILEPLGRHAETTLAALGYKNIEVKIGDGYRGWPERSPFDAIIVTAAPAHIPQPLIEQLAMNGRMVLPLGDREQTMVILRKTP